MSKLVNTVLFFLLHFVALTSSAFEDVNISKGVQQLMPIAINNFESSSSYDQKLVDNLLQVIEGDLTHCGFFKIIAPAAFIETAAGVGHKPHFASWRQINANLLLNGQMIRKSSNEFVLKVILWDVVSQKSILAESFVAPTKSWRKLAHQVADKIYHTITGDVGYFDTRFFYISEITKGKNINKRLAVMDWDGENHQFLSDGKVLVLTPRLAPNNQHLLYVSYQQKSPKIFIRDLKTGRSTLLGNFAAMSFAPRFSPDGSKIVFSLAKKGVTDIFELDLTTKQTRQITSGFAINTSPSYSPDGSKIYFHSDRSGLGQIYAMDASGAGVVRISFGVGNYSAPVCSPNGKYLVFTKSIRGEGFFIGVMRTDGSDERTVASGYLVEGASWGGNNRMIVFAKTSSPYGGASPSTRIYTIDVSGRNERIVPTPHDASDPEWAWHHGVIK
jgi:TolB protein